MPNVLRTAAVCAVCLTSLAHLAPAAAQSAADQAGEGNASIYNLDRSARVGGVAIDGPIDKAVARQAIELIKSVRPDVDELMVYLNSPGGDVLAAIEIGEEVRRQWAVTAVDEDGECFGACVLVLAAGVRRTPAPDRVGIYRPSLDSKESARPPRDRAGQTNATLARKVQVYLSHMGMPEKLFKEMMQRPSDKMLLLNASRLKTFGLDGIDPAYAKWLRENADPQPPQSN